MKNHISTECRASQWKVDKYTQQREEEKKNKNNKDNNNNNSKNNNQNNQKKEQTSNVELAMSITESNKTTNDNCWYIDSGCTQFMTNDKTKLFNLRTTNTKVVGPISKESKEVNQEGDCRVRCVGEEKEVSDIRLKNVLFVQNIRRNLISVKNLCQAGATVSFEGEKFKVMKDGKVVMKGKKDKTGLFALKEKEEESTTYHNETQEESVEEGEEEVENEDEEEFEANNVNILQQWHERLGHLSIKQIEKLNKTNKLEGLKKEQLE